MEFIPFNCGLDAFEAVSDPGAWNELNSETMKEASVDRNVKRL